MELFSLAGKNAVVVGGAGGLGQAIAQGLAEAGARVAIASRKEESLRRAVEEIKTARGKDVAWYTVDASDEESVKALVAATVKDMGQVDILVNSQGLNKKFPAEDFDMGVFQQMLSVNVAGVMMCCKHFGKQMMEHGYGKIINVSSVRGKIATRAPGNAAYCSTKGAVDIMTRQLAAEFGETPMMTAVIEQRGGDAYRKQQADALPMRRMAVPQDCVGPAVFLASHASDFVTGNIIYPDGGLTAVG